MGKNKNKSVRIDSNNPAFMFIDEDLEIYKYFDGIVCVGNTHAYDGAKKVLDDIKTRITQIKNTSKPKTDYVVNIIFEKLPNDAKSSKNFETYHRSLNVRNIYDEFDNVKSILWKLVKRLRTLESAKDFCTQYRVTIICCKKYI